MNTIAQARRNLGRNRKRTGITLAALALTTAVLVVAYAMLDGLIEDLEAQITSLVTGEVQIYASGYTEELSFYRTIEDVPGVIRTLESLAVNAAPRSYGFGLLSLSGRTSGCQFWGVDPAAEKRAFLLPGKIRQGRYLPDAARKGLVLGFGLAGFLRAGVGDEVDVVVQAADGSLGHDFFTVLGILESSGRTVDMGAAVIHSEDFAELFVSEGMIHEIAVHSRGRIPPGRLKDTVQAAAPGAEVKAWWDILPQYAGTVENARKAVWIFSASFFLVAGLGIMNTMLMSAYERTWEYGLMKGLGAPPRKIAGLVLAESAVLCLSATVIGAGLGSAASLFLARYGIDLSFLSTDTKMTDAVLSTVWRAAFDWKNVALPLLSLWAVCLPASLYPAVSAARRDPVRTIHGRY